MTTNRKPLLVTIKRTGGYAAVVCECGWESMHSTRTIKGIALARQDAQDHAKAHTTGAGFFHQRHGWTPCDPHPAVTA